MTVDARRRLLGRAGVTKIAGQPSGGAALSVAHWHEPSGGQVAEIPPPACIPCQIRNISPTKYMWWPGREHPSTWVVGSRGLCAFTRVRSDWRGGGPPSPRVAEQREQPSASPARYHITIDEIHQTYL